MKHIHILILLPVLIACGEKNKFVADKTALQLTTEYTCEKGQLVNEETTGWWPGSVFKVDWQHFNCKSDNNEACIAKISEDNWKKTDCAMFDWSILPKNFADATK